MPSNYTHEQIVRIEKTIRDFFANDSDNPLAAFYSVNFPDTNPDLDQDIYVLAIYPEEALHGRSDTEFYYEKGGDLYLSFPDEFYGKVFTEFCTWRSALKSKLHINHYLPCYKCLFGKEIFEGIMETGTLE
ncbi:MAG: hypothetical protein EOM62_17760 [Bacteroidia bacterium]|nr:hypothetical protein [Bacteroidia bacterium]